MKVILTENQYSLLLYNEGVAQLLQETVKNEKRLDSLKKKIKHLLLIGISVSTIVSALSKLNIPSKEKEILVNIATSTENIQHHKTDSIFQKKVDACREYMEQALSNQGYSIQSTDLKPETLVRVSIEKSFDLPFLMAAAHQESCFGATPRAKRTNSVFSEGCYDDGRDMVKYPDPNDSVEGYIDLLNRIYIVNGKGLMDLLKPGGFVNYQGNRYAKDEKYEQKLKYLRNRILKKYPELA